MSQQIYRTVAANNSPSLVITAQRNGTVIDVTNATVTLIITNEKTGVVTQAAGSCSLTTPASGVVTYAPSATDFPSAGRYLGELKIVFSGGKVERLYELLLVIARDATT